MPTQKQGYFTQSGDRVPSVTTVLGRWKEAGPLMHWAAEQAKAGKDYRQVRDSAADAGTVAHRLAELHLHTGQDWENARLVADQFKLAQDEADGAFGAYQAFLEWQARYKLKIVKSEVAMVSEVHKYAGTLDHVEIEQKQSMFDVKTGKRIYLEHWLQVAAYGALWLETTGKPIEGGYHIVIFHRPEKAGDPVGFDHSYKATLPKECFEQFLRLKDALSCEKELKRALNV